MSAPKNSDPNKVYLSASRIDCFNECSQRYAARYLLKLPDEGNDGSNRGSTCHDILELLLKPRHHKFYSAAIHHDTLSEVPALWRYLKRVAKKYGVDDAENLDMIDGFIMVALKNEFHGPKGTIQSFGEREFNLSINEGGRRWNARGKIDQTFVVKDEEGLLVSVTDFKSSKKKFEDDKIDFNVQSIIYQLALKHLHPEINRRRFRFLFLKFPVKPWQEMEQLTDDQLEGYEYILTDMQDKIEKFTLANASDNLAANNEKNRWLCGRDGLKKDGTKNFICPARKPMDYWVALKDGKIVRSEKKVMQAKKVATKNAAGETIWIEDETIEKRRYLGCSAYFTPEGTRRSFCP